MAEIPDDVAVTRLDVVGEGCSPLCSSLLVERVESFRDSHRMMLMICFTDAATSDWSEAGVWMCCAAVIILPPDTEAKEMEVFEVIPRITNNTEAEITTIVVALELEAASELHRSSTDSCKSLRTMLSCSLIASLPLPWQYRDHTLLTITMLFRDYVPAFMHSNLKKYLCLAGESPATEG